MTEAQIQARVLLTLGRRPDVRIFRNNVGAYKDATGTLRRFGLLVGSADLIGWVVVDGRAIFLSVEIKTPIGKPSPEQETWLRNVRRMGGIAFIARSAEEAIAELESQISNDNHRIR
ncbi:MAG: VRR-NUC domain-containing protein [Chthoniobacteraceae bacterium]|nr:VRR-NUC domain-containing protein [Chthoniobacteraceae bacterium]